MSRPHHDPWGEDTRELLDYNDPRAWRSQLGPGDTVALVPGAVSAQPITAIVTRISEKSVWAYLDGTTRRFDIESGKQVGGPEDLFRRHVLMSCERAAEFVQVRAELAGVRQLTGAKERCAVRERSPHVPHYEIDNRQKRQGK